MLIFRKKYLNINNIQKNLEGLGLTKKNYKSIWKYYEYMYSFAILILKDLKNKKPEKCIKDITKEYNAELIQFYIP